MKVGIIGFARSGKTTIFNALTGAKAAVGAYGSREANIAVLKVPDDRVDRLAVIYSPKKTTYAEFQFVDIAPNESTVDAKAIDAAALNQLKAADALAHVVRAFENDQVLHPLGDVDPGRDCVRLEEELQLDDLIIIEKRIQRLEKEKKKELEYDVLQRCREAVESGRPLRTLEFTPQEALEISGFCFLSQKPLMLLGNYGEDKIGVEDPSGLGDYAREHGLALVDLCGAMELEVADLEPEEREAFREDLGLGEESRMKFLGIAYEMLGLMSFLTAGEPEVRAWTIPVNTKAVDAAGVIHSDIQRGFIRAETVGFDDFMDAGSLVAAKERGAVRVEGKEYIMQDGDIVLFRFNV